MQHLLGRAVWDHDGVRDNVRAYLTEALGDPEAVLIIDETGDLKKGSQSVGVQRQYTGTAGRVENAQVAVYLLYASDAGHALIDRELYLPKGWIDDPDRCRAAGILLVVAALTERARHPSPSGLIGLTCNEVQHLLAALLARPAGDLGHRLRWSVWRRRHKPAPAPATTNDKPPDHDDHDHGWSTRLGR